MSGLATSEHRWLQRLVGDWTSEGTAVMETGATPTKFAGTESVRSLDGLWTISEARGGLPGEAEMSSMMTIGFDPRRGRFVGTFVAEMMTHLWVYDGALDAARDELVLETVGPALAPDGPMTNYRDRIRFLDADHRTLTSEMQRGDGTWTEFMTVHYRRRT